MLKRLTGVVVTAFLLVSTVLGASEEAIAEKGFTISGGFGVLSMNGTGSATPGAWDTQTSSIEFDVTNRLTTGLVRQNSASKLGLGWDSNSLAIFSLGIGYRFNERLFANLLAEWANNHEYDSFNDYYYDYAPGYPGYSYEYLDESTWIQASLAFMIQVAPFQKHPQVYLTAGMLYTRFQMKMDFVKYGDYTTDYVNTRRHYDDVGGALGYTVGAGYIFAKKAGSREAYVQGSWTYMPYGTALGMSDEAYFFNRITEIQLGGFRLETGIRFFVGQLF